MPYLTPNARRRALRSPTAPLIAILIAHIALSAQFALTLPALESYDEPGHYAYARYIARNGSLPERGVRLSEADESHQPPLYYALVAPFIAPIDTSDDVQATPVWAAYFSIRPDAELNDFSRGGTALAIRAARIGTAVLSSFAVVMTYLTLRTLLPGRPRVWLVAAATHAFWPMFTFMSGVISNDNGVAWSGALALYAAARLIAHRHHPNFGDYVLAALAASASTLMKDSGFVQIAFLVVLCSALGLAHLARRRGQALTYLVGFMLITVALVAVGAIGSDGRSIRQFQTVASAAIHIGSQVPIWQVQFEAGDAPDLESPSVVHVGLGLLELLRRDFEEFFGVFNRNSLRLPPSWYWPGEALALVCIAVALRQSIASRRPGERTALWLMGIFVLITLAAPAWRSLAGDAPWLFHGRFALPCVGAVAGIIAIGLDNTAGRAGQVLSALALSGLAWVSLAAPSVAVGSIFARPVLFADTVARFVRPQPGFSIVFGDGQHDYIEMLGYILPSPRAQKGGVMEVFAYWRALRPIPDRYALRIEGFTREGISLRNPVEAEPAWGGFPTTLWRPGEVYGEGHYLFIWDRDDVDAPFIGQFKPIWINLRTGEPLQARCADGRPCDGKFGDLPIGLSLEEAARWRALPVCCQFDRGVGLALDAPRDVWAGEAFTTTLVWHARARLSADYTVFFQLIGPDGRIVAQHDSPPRDGRYPTRAWGPGEVTPESRSLFVPDDLPPGQYTLAVGLYDPIGGARLTTRASGSVETRDHAFLFKINIR
ncbi:MAG: hypothetical protein RML99_01485 [Anaerolineae bacterium]|nr:hypothetical protein [Anaerolineae bacterium]